MSESIEFALGETSVRFTPDGMIFIEDAINVLASNREEKPKAVWKKIKEDHPGILNHCGSYASQNGDLMPTVDIEGLDKIFILLPEYI